MEKQAFIELIISDKEKVLSPKDMDIKDVIDFILYVESLVFPSLEEKQNRTPIGYEFEKDTSKHLFYLDIKAVSLFDNLLKEIKYRESFNSLDYKRQLILEKLQRKAIKKAYAIVFKNSISESNSLIIDATTNYIITPPTLYTCEFYLYGEISLEGESLSLHILTQGNQTLEVSATKEQLLNIELGTRKLYGLKVRGRKNMQGNVYSALELIHFIPYKPVFNKSLLEVAIKKASHNLNKIRDVDVWLENIKAERI